MIIVKIIAATGFFFMLGMVIVAFATGDFFAEWGIILSYIWGIGGLADLYTGLVLFAAWVAYRERSWGISLTWFLLLITLGFVAACAYIYIAAQRSENSWEKFWMGKAYKHA